MLNRYKNKSSLNIILKLLRKYYVIRKGLLCTFANSKYKDCQDQVKKALDQFYVLQTFLEERFKPKKLIKSLFRLYRNYLPGIRKKVSSGEKSPKIFQKYSKNSHKIKRLQ